MCRVEYHLSAFRFVFARLEALGPGQSRLPVRVAPRGNVRRLPGGELARVRKGGALALRHSSSSQRRSGRGGRDAEALLNAVGLDTSKVQIARGASDWYHPGRSGVIQLGPKLQLAQFGEIHPAVLEELDIKGPLVGFEVFMDAIPQPKAGRKTTRPPLTVSDFQAVTRDFAFVVSRDVAVADMIRAARGADRNLITAVDIFDLYEGERIGADAKSVAMSVRLEPMDRTLTDKEIDAVGEKIIANMAKSVGASLRG